MNASAQIGKETISCPMDEQPTMDSCLSVQNLMYAASLCRRGTSWKTSVKKFSSFRPTRCLQLFKQLKNGEYRPGKTFRFVINDRGKTRKINAISIDDRVVQRWFCDWVLIPIIRARIIEGNSACIKGRGISHAIENIRTIYNNAPISSWVLQFDFHSYFETISQDGLLRMFRQLIADDRLFGILESIIRANKVGLELGSHVSQLCAVYYPNELDHVFLLLDGCLGYQRYMDDAIAVFTSREEARTAMEVLEMYCGEMGLTLNEKKTHINRVTHPLLFCKRRIEKSENGTVVLIRKEQTRRMRKRAKRIIMHPDINREPVIAANHGQVNQGDVDLGWFVDRIWEVD